MSEKPSPITQHDLERELTVMTSPSNESTELWRDALHQTRSGRRTRGRRIPGRRNKLVWTPSVVELLAVVVICAGVIAVLIPATGSARRSDVGSAVGSAEVLPYSNALPQLPLTDMGTHFRINELADAVESRSSEDVFGRETVEQSEPSKSIAQRQIAKTFWISLIVPDAKRAIGLCESVLDPSRGEFVEASKLRGIAGNRTGELTLRVASDRQNQAMDTIRTFGEIESVNQNAEDLTVAMLDASARLKALRQVEAEIIALIDRRDHDTLVDILAAQTELGKTRGQIESLEARLRIQTQRVQLSTITVMIRERVDPTPDALPVYRQTVVSAGRDALMLLDRAIYAVVVASPVWLAMLLTWAIWRILRRRNNSRDPLSQ